MEINSLVIITGILLVSIGWHLLFRGGSEEK